jgi:hypothetical protein
VGINTRLTTASEAVGNMGAGVVAGAGGEYELLPAAARAMGTAELPGLREGGSGGWEYMGIGLLYDAGGGAGPAYPVNGPCILWTWGCGGLGYGDCPCASKGDIGEFLSEPDFSEKSSMGAAGSGLVSLNMLPAGQERRRFCLRRRYVFRTMNMTRARATTTEAAIIPPSAPPESVWLDALPTLLIVVGVALGVVVTKTTDLDVLCEELAVSSVAAGLFVDKVVKGVVRVDCEEAEDVNVCEEAERDGDDCEELVFVVEVTAIDAVDVVGVVLGVVL